MAFPTLNSLGNLTRLPQACQGLQVAARNNLPTLGAHAYTVNGSLMTSMAWCPGRFVQTELDTCWNTWTAMIESVSVPKDLCA